MSRAVSQNIAWISAFVLSSVVFAAVLGLIFMVSPKHKGGASHENAGSHQNASEHGAGTHQQEDHGAAAAHDSGHAKQVPETPANSHHEAEEEISADSFKKPEGSHSDAKSNKPHH